MSPGWIEQNVHHIEGGGSGQSITQIAGDLYQVFLSNVCAHLIPRYQLGHTLLPENATQDSGFLVQLLVEAAEKDRLIN